MPSPVTGAYGQEASRTDMDVKCEQCGTEYEFDDARVTESGINVKCTHCGHIFRVARHAVVVEEHPVVAETRPAATRSTAEAPALPRAPTPARNRVWMIRKARSAELLEFKDLSTLQKWILERKVSRDDEISKTGDSWKPLGSIVELSSFFLVVEGDPRPAPQSEPVAPSAPPTTTQQRAALSPPSLPPAPPPPPRGRDDLLDTGEFRLEGPSPSEPIQVQITSPPGGAPIMATGQHDLRGRRPIPAQSSAEVNPQVTVHRTPQASAAPVPRQDSSVSFHMPDDEIPEERGNTSRGFVIGVVVTGVLFALAYVAFDRMRPREEPTPARPVTPPISVATTAAPRAMPTAQLLVLLERADIDYYRDTETTYKQAEDAYAEVLRLLGEPPSDAGIAARALVGRARAAVARAEYRKLHQDAVESTLGAAEEALARARALVPDDIEADLAWADYYRVKGDRVASARYLDRLFGRADTRPELVFIRSWLSAPDAEPATLVTRIDAMPENARRLPRVAFIRAEALVRADQTNAALQALVELVASNPGHEPGRALLEALRAKKGTSGLPSQPPSAPETSAPRTAAPVAPPSAVDPPRSAPVARTAPPSAAPATDAALKGAGEDFDGLMVRGAKMLEDGKSARAVKLFEAAAQKKPRSPEPFAYLGWCYIDLGKHAEALSQFKQALERSPRYSDAMYGVAEAHEKSGRVEDARKAYEAYLAAHPAGRRSEMARRRLERLP